MYMYMYMCESIRQVISSVCLAYDNMCHLDSLRISKSQLPLPVPSNEAWQLISKVIDRLHLQNHVVSHYLNSLATTYFLLYSYYCILELQYIDCYIWAI